MSSDNPSGAPVHPAPGDNSYVRWANGTLGQVKSVDPTTGWFQIEAEDTRKGWITRKYFFVVPDLNQIQEIGSRIQQILSMMPTTNSAFAEKVSQGFYLNVDVHRPSQITFHKLV